MLIVILIIIFAILATIAIVLSISDLQAAALGYQYLKEEGTLREGEEPTRKQKIAAYHRRINEDFERILRIRQQQQPIFNTTEQLAAQIIATHINKESIPALEKIITRCEPLDRHSRAVMYNMGKNHSVLKSPTNEELINALAICRSVLTEEEYSPIEVIELAAKSKEAGDQNVY